MERILTIELTPRTTDIGGLLELLQQAATTHAETWHCGREEMLRDYNCVWMIARVWVKMYAPLPLRPLQIRTWTRPLSRGYSRREFDIFCDGCRIAESVQAWVLTNADTRRMQNMAAVRQMVQAPCCEEGKTIALHRPALPDQLTVLGQVTVQAADIDSNGHMNNAHYPRYALSVLPPRPICEMSLSYSRECFAGDVIEIQGRLDADTAWLRGVVDGHGSFDMQVAFFPNGSADRKLSLQFCLAP